jgi:transglutaminase-like putative cysteine protease
LPAGDFGVKRTIHWMNQLARGTEGARNPRVRELAIAIVRGQPDRDDYAQASALYYWVKSNIEFRGEPDEVISSPLVTLQIRAGDCDDHATLMTALLRALGIEARFVTVAADASAPETFTHVYTQAWIRQSQQWLTLDTTVANARPGWQPARVTRVRTWDMYVRTMHGLGDDSTTKQVTQTITDTAKTISNALAARISNQVQYGQLPNAAVSFQNGAATATVTPTTMVVGAAAALGAIALAMRK